MITKVKSVKLKYKLNSITYNDHENNQKYR